jgi:hypothetical protein
MLHDEIRDCHTGHSSAVGPENLNRLTFLTFAPVTSTLERGIHAAPLLYPDACVVSLPS